jgi:hypothetical protein
LLARSLSARAPTLRKHFGLADPEKLSNAPPQTSTTPRLSAKDTAQVAVTDAHCAGELALRDSISK